MISFHNIFSIAKYEITTLLRSWFFRIFAILAMVILFFFNLGTMILGNGGTGSWDMKALPSVIPYVNLLLLNTVQAIIAIFLASDFLKRDKKLDTTDVIYIRSMSNGEYVFGKTLGNLAVFIILNLIVLSEALIFNLIAENVIVDWMAYLEYFLIISLPTLLFILGLSFFVMSVLKNQAITFILLLGYVAVTIFYLNTKFYFLFDYMAYSIPLLNSDFIGFGNLPTILIHRGMYASFGIAFIFLTITLLKRLPQSPFSNKITLIPAVLFFALGIWLGKMHLSQFAENQELRENVKAVNDTQMDKLRLKVDSYKMNITHDGNSIDVVATLKVSNPYDKPVSDFVFTLNPGLTLSKTTFNTQEINPKRDLNLIEFNGRSLDPGDTASISFTYQGKPNEAVSYLDIDDKTLEEQPPKSFLFQVDKRSAMVTPDYVLLTRESNWYPVAGTTFGTHSKQWMQKQFSSYDITVKTKPGLTAISQGKVQKGDGTFHFTNKHNLPEVSLVIGDYTEKTDTIDGLEFNLYLHPGHDYYTKFLEPIKDTIPTLIKEALKDYERSVDLYYPFERFTLIEVPAQFYSYQRVLIGGREQVQPETVLFPEKGLMVNEADFEGSVKRMERWGDHGDNAQTTPEEKKTMAFNNFLSSFKQASARPNINRSGGDIQVTEKDNPLYIFPLFYNDAYFVESDRWPIANRIFESYLKLSSSGDSPMGFMRNLQGMSEDEQANLALQDYSFAQLLDDPEKTKIIDNVIELKGQSLFSIIKKRAGDAAFDDFMYNFLQAIKFKGTTIDVFNSQVENQFHIDLLPFMNQWFNSKSLPGYLIGGVTAVNVLDGDQLKTMVKFKITNAEPTEGIVIVQFRLGGGGGPGRMRFMGGGAETIDKLVGLDGNQTKEVSFLLDGTPRGVTINTLASKNIPSEIRLQLGDIEQDPKATPYEGEKISDIPVKLSENNEIICDDEDKCFKTTQGSDESLLQRLILGDDQSTEKYVGFNTWHAPRVWKATTNSNFYGKYIRSAHYIKSGDGSKTATWSFGIPRPGFYQVYSYISKNNNMRGRRDQNRPQGEYNYSVKSSEGTENVTIDLKDAEDGWNNLGTYNFAGDSVKVVLSNKSAGDVVVADAVKLVKQ